MEIEKDKDLFGAEVPVVYFKSMESKDDDGWMMGYACGRSWKDNKNYVITTHNLKSDEVPKECDDAKTFSELVSSLLNHHYNNTFKNYVSEINKENEKLLLENRSLQPIPLTLENIPDEEVIAIGYQNECLVGYIRNDGDESGEEFICESGSEILEDVSHFILIPKVK